MGTYIICQLWHRDNGDVTMGTYIFCQLWHRDAGLSFASWLRKKKARHLPCSLNSRRTACMESATCCGMESRFSEYGINANCIVWNQDRRGTENTACRLMPCADEPRCHTTPKALILFLKHRRNVHSAQPRFISSCFS